MADAADPSSTALRREFTRFYISYPLPSAGCQAGRCLLLAAGPADENSKVIFLQAQELAQRLP